jgi:hypothetical protein
MIAIWIHWGHTYDREGSPQKYDFSTQGEVNAFLSGIYESNGWDESTVVDNKSCTFCKAAMKPEFCCDADSDDDDSDAPFDYSCECGAKLCALGGSEKWSGGGEKAASAPKV